MSGVSATGGTAMPFGTTPFVAVAARLDKNTRMPDMLYAGDELHHRENAPLGDELATTMQLAEIGKQLANIEITPEKRAGLTKEQGRLYGKLNALRQERGEAAIAIPEPPRWSDLLSELKKRFSGEALRFATSYVAQTLGPEVSASLGIDAKQSARQILSNMAAMPVLRLVEQFRSVDIRGR